MAAPSKAQRHFNPFPVQRGAEKEVSLTVSLSKARTAEIHGLARIRFKSSNEARCRHETDSRSPLPVFETLDIDSNHRILLGAEGDGARGDDQNDHHHDENFDHLGSPAFHGSDCCELMYR